MTTSNLKTRIAKAAAAITVVGLAAGAFVATSGTAGADPQQYRNPLVGVGSDTTQDVMNAYAGFNQGRVYEPLVSSQATGYQQLMSWDAVAPGGSAAVRTCITVKTGFGQILRPNGSGSGARGLSRALTSQAYGISGSCGQPAAPAALTKNPNGMFDFARSSAPPSGSNAELTYVPFGRDFVGLSYYFKPVGGGAPINGNVTFTRAQIISLMSTSTVSSAPLQFDPDGPTSDIFGTGSNTGTIPVAPCGIQTGSGTYSFFQVNALGLTAGADQDATSFCRLLGGLGNAAGSAGGPGRVQESDGTIIKAKGDLAPGTMLVTPYSAANFIAQSNGVAASQLGAGVDFANISDVASNTSPNRIPYNVTAGVFSPNAVSYANTTFGRDVYNVFETDVAIGAGNAAIKELFIGPSAKICTGSGPTGAITTRLSFGFEAPVQACGSTTLTGNFVAGTS